MSRPGLALLFTPGVRIRDWRTAGFLEREIAYYGRLGRAIGRVTFVSHGRRDPALEVLLAGIGTIQAHRLPEALFWLTVPFRLRHLDQGVIVKTNQFSNVPAPVLAKWLFGSRVVARGGFVPSEPWRHGRRSPRRLLATLGEALLLRSADLVMVTSTQAATYVRERYRLPTSKVRVIPNFVDITVFRPSAAKMPGLVGLVGRLSSEKNVLAAIDAVAGLSGVRLRVIGEGPLRAAAEQRARSSGADCEFLGTLPHARLPDALAACDVFLLPSLYEGHPKALIEAMATGLPCVVAPSPGVASVVSHGMTGFIAGDATAVGLREALRTVLADEGLRQRLGDAAREKAKEFAIDSIVKLEVQAYREAGWL